MSHKAYLLDSNVLIALSTPDHTAHDRALSWFRRNHPFATCPITQGALIRFHLRWAAQPAIAAAKDLLRGITALPAHQFWADDQTYLEIPESGVMGHRQVTDAYLVRLASAHDGVLATMDQALAAIHSSVVLI